MYSPQSNYCFGYLIIYEECLEFLSSCWAILLKCFQLSSGQCYKNYVVIYCNTAYSTVNYCVFKFTTIGQCYKKNFRGNILPFLSNYQGSFVIHNDYTKKYYYVMTVNHHGVWFYIIGHRNSKTFCGRNEFGNIIR